MGNKNEEVGSDFQKKSLMFWSLSSRIIEQKHDSADGSIGKGKRYSLYSPNVVSVLFLLFDYR